MEKPTELSFLNPPYLWWSYIASTRHLLDVFPYPRYNPGRKYWEIFRQSIEDVGIEMG